MGDRVITRVNTPHVSNRERWEVTAIDSARREVGLQRIGGDERRVALRSRYLDFTTPSGEPSLQHAYAISAYAAEGGSQLNCAKFHCSHGGERYESGRRKEHRSSLNYSVFPIDRGGPAEQDATPSCHRPGDVGRGPALRQERKP